MFDDDTVIRDLERQFSADRHPSARSDLPPLTRAERVLVIVVRWYLAVERRVRGRR